MPDYVYLMSHPQGYWKVGCSMNPRRRCSRLRQDYKVKMILEKMWDCEFAASVEMIAHATLRPYRVGSFREVYNAPLNTVLSAINDALKDMGAVCKPITITRRQKMWAEGHKLKLKVAT